MQEAGVVMEVVKMSKQRPLKKIGVPTDRCTSITFSGDGKPEGQNITTGRGSVFFAITPTPTVDEDGNPQCSLSSPLNGKDELLHAVVSSLYYDTKPTEEGSRYIALSTIWRSLGYKKNPTKAGRDGLLKRLWRLSGKTITINNSAEVNIKGNRYPAVIIQKKRILNFEETTVEICGQEATAIEILREPPLAAFARGRGQMLTVPASVFAIANKSDLAAGIVAAVLGYISEARHTGKPVVVGWKVIYKATEVDVTRRHRVKNYAIGILEELKEKGIINNFETDKESFTLCEKMN